MLEVDLRAVPSDDVPTALRNGYSIVLGVEERVDSIFRLLQQDTSRTRRELVALESAALRWTGVLLLVTSMFVAGAVLYLSRSVARPLARLSAGAAALKRGDLDTRIDVDTPDEFGMLAAEFNEMTTALREHQRRLVETEKLAGIGRLAAGVAHENQQPAPDHPRLPLAEPGPARSPPRQAARRRGGRGAALPGNRGGPPRALAPRVQLGAGPRSTSPSCARRWPARSGSPRVTRPAPSRWPAPGMRSPTPRRCARRSSTW